MNTAPTKKAPLPPRPGSGLPLTQPPTGKPKDPLALKVEAALEEIDATEFDERSHRVLYGRMDLWKERAP